MRKDLKGKLNLEVSETRVWCVVCVLSLKWRFPLAGKELSGGRVGDLGIGLHICFPGKSPSISGVASGRHRPHTQPRVRRWGKASSDLPEPNEA